MLSLVHPSVVPVRCAGKITPLASGVVAVLANAGGPANGTEKLPRCMRPAGFTVRAGRARGADGFPAPRLDGPRGDLDDPDNPLTLGGADDAPVGEGVDPVRVIVAGHVLGPVVDLYSIPVSRTKCLCRSGAIFRSRIRGRAKYVPNRRYPGGFIGTLRRSERTGKNRMVCTTPWL